MQIVLDKGKTISFSSLVCRRPLYANSHGTGRPSGRRGCAVLYIPLALPISTRLDLPSLNRHGGPESATATSPIQPNDIRPDRSCSTFCVG